MSIGGGPGPEDSSQHRDPDGLGGLDGNSFGPFQDKELFFDRLISQGQSSPFAVFGKELGYDSHENLPYKLMEHGVRLRERAKDLVFHEVRKALARPSTAGYILIEHRDVQGRDVLYSEEGILCLMDIRVRNLPKLDAHFKASSELNCILHGPGKVRLTIHDVVMMVAVKEDKHMSVELIPVYDSEAISWIVRLHFAKDLVSKFNSKAVYQVLFKEALVESLKKLHISPSRYEEFRTRFTRVQDQRIFVQVNDKRLLIDFVPLLGAPSGSLVPLQCVAHFDGLVMGQSHTPKVLVLSERET
jgi:hypothetical protein